MNTDILRKLLVAGAVVAALARAQQPKPKPAEPCEACGGSEIEEVYAGHGTVYEIPCSECQKPKA